MPRGATIAEGKGCWLGWCGAVGPAIRRCAISKFASWVELPNGRIKFLTSDCLGTNGGAALIKHVRNPEDLAGHGAIRFYYGLERDEGVNRECTDFFSPANFPPEIAQAIKEGKMEGIGIGKGLLNQRAWAEYEKTEQGLWVQYQKSKRGGEAEYERIEQRALWEYWRITEEANDGYDIIKEGPFAGTSYWKTEQGPWEQYEKILDAALEEYWEINQRAFAEWEKIFDAALEEYEKGKQETYWSLFANPDNRNPAWR